MHAFRMLLLCLCVALALLAAPVAGKTCRVRTRNELWKHGKGKFANTQGPHWAEYDRDGNEIGKYKMVQSVQQQVVLEDKERNMRILLNEELAGIAHGDEQQFTHLHNGEWQKVVDCTENAAHNNNMLQRLALVGCLCGVAAAENYAVLVAGSNLWENYRHQADIAHAYQILTRGGVKAENIITMSYDDVASAPENPFPGELYNKPAATMAEANEVYGCMKDHIDYRGVDNSPENFLAVLTGNASAAGGKKVLTSGADDRVFIYYADHGGSGIIGFPVFPNPRKLHVEDFLKALDTMWEKKMYSELVIYLEACDSASMFAHLPTDRNIYAVSSTQPGESAYGYYCEDVHIGATSMGKFLCLGDYFSVNWLEHDDVADLTVESLHQQFVLLRNLTIPKPPSPVGSHPMQWGTKAMDKEMASAYQGAGHTLHGGGRSISARDASQAVDARDVGMHYAYHQYLSATGASRTAKAAALVAIVEHRDAEDAKFAALAAAFPAAPHPSSPAYLPCWKPAHEAVETHCGVYSGYSLKHSHVATDACRALRGDVQAVVQTVKTVCSKL